MAQPVPSPDQRKALAALLMEHLQNLPVQRALNQQLPTLAVRAARDIQSSETQTQALVDRLDAWRDIAREEDRTLRQILPPPAIELATSLAAYPWRIDEKTWMRLMDHPAIRSLLVSVLTRSLHAFTDRISKLDEGLLGGLGSKAVSTGRGLLGGLSGAARSMVGNVRSEITQAMASKVKEFAAGAADDTMASIAGWLSSPEHAEQLAELRVSWIGLLLDTPVKELASHADTWSTEELVGLTLQALRKAADDPRTQKALSEGVAGIHARFGDETAGSWIELLGLQDLVADATAELLQPLIDDFLDSEGFSTWWGEVHEA